MIGGHSDPDASGVHIFDGLEEPSAILGALLVLPLMAVAVLVFGGAAVFAARVLGVVG